MRVARGTLRSGRLAAGASTVVVLVAIVAAGCSGSSSKPTATPRTSTPVDLSLVETRAVPAGKGVAQRSATAPDARQPIPANYRESEHLVAGMAALYRGPATGPVTVESKDHPFVTRVLTRAPVDPADFSGSVWVEPFNTSGGGDADAVWSMIAPLVVQRGDAWVGVTVRSGQVAKLQAFDTARYADLRLDSNAHAWDILRDVGALLKTNGKKSPIPRLRVKHVYVAGYSQSGVDTATFGSAFNATTRLSDGAPVFDGYLVGARSANLTPLQSGSSLIPKFESAAMRPLDSPVLSLEPQTNVEGFAVDVPTELLRQSGIEGADKIQTPTAKYVNAGSAYVRRPDANVKADRFRLYEIAGAPHVTGSANGCEGSSSFPVAAFTRAAAASLARWAEEGVAPSTAPRIKMATLDKVSVGGTDQDGNPVGGVRSPFLDVPLSRYELHSSTNSPVCIGAQTGNETVFTADELEQRYGSSTAYMRAFTKNLDATIKAGFLLQLDRQSILDAQQARATTAFGSS